MRVHVVSGMWPVHTLCLTPDSDASRALYLAGLAWIAECHVKYLSPRHLHLHLSIWACGHLLSEHPHSAHVQSGHQVLHTSDILTTGFSLEPATRTLC